MGMGCWAQLGVGGLCFQFSAPLSMGTSPGLGSLVRARAWEEPASCEQVGVSLSSQPWPPASPRAFLLSHGLKLSVFDVRAGGLRLAPLAVLEISLLHPYN